MSRPSTITCSNRSVRCRSPPDDLACFPDYLVCIPPDRNEAPENASSARDAVERPRRPRCSVQICSRNSIGTGRFAFGVRSARLATACDGAGRGCSSCSRRARICTRCAPDRRGLGFTGAGAVQRVLRAGVRQPAGCRLTSVAAAACAVARLPAFSYEASAGGNWAARFSLENNPPARRRLAGGERRVRRHEHCSASPSLGVHVRRLRAVRRRHSAHFARVASARRGARRCGRPPTWLALDERARRHGGSLHLLAIDGEDALHRVIVDLRLMQAARRCLPCGVASRSTAASTIRTPNGCSRSRRRRGPRTQVSLPATSRSLPQRRPHRLHQLAAANGAAAPPQPMRRQPRRALARRGVDRDRALPELQRMPAHQRPHVRLRRAQKQAHIKDLGAGTYRQLVEAA